LTNTIYFMEYDYNTRRKKLVLPEYGRNIQKMVDHVLSLEDREERNKAAHTVIAVMGNLNPHLRDVNDFKHKLWDHLAIISDFKLDIDAPYDMPTPEKLEEKPNKIPYDQKAIRSKHYGHSIKLMIDAAAAVEDEEEKNELIEMIANHMKKTYLTWNREAVDDAEIFMDLKALSGDKIEPNPEMKLIETREILAKNQPPQHYHKKKKGKKK